MADTTPAPKPKRARRKPATVQRKIGRPSLLTPARMASLLGSIASGNYMEPSAQMVGIGLSTLTGWRNRGEQAIVDATTDDVDAREVIAGWLDGHERGYGKDNPKWTAPGPDIIPAEEWPYALLVVSLESARAQAEIQAVASIRAAGQRQWQANAWWLERVHHRRYGRHDKVEHGGIQGGAPIGVDMNVSVEDLLTRLDGLKGDGGE